MIKPEKAHWGDWSEDDGTIMTIDDSEGQRLWLRVGPVFTKGGVSKVPGIWIEYQEKSLNTPMQGPVLLSPSTWEKMKKYIDSYLTEFKKQDYDPSEK